MELSALLAFVAVAATLIAVPGPDWAFVVAAGARDRVVLPAVGGLAAGYLLLTVVVALGVGPLVAASPTALAVLTLAGAGYLVHLGIGNLRGRRNPHRPGADVVAAGRGAFVRRGIGVSALNPKALLFFVAFLPQFARPGGAWPLPAQLAALGGLWALLGGLFYTALGYMADRALGARPALAQLITRLAGAAMIVVGLVLLGEQLLRTAGG